MLPLKKLPVLSYKRTNTTLTFTWNKQVSATYYNIYKYDFSADKYVYLGSTQGNVNSYYISGIPEGSYNKFKVSAVALHIEGAKSAVYKEVNTPKKVKIENLPRVKRKRKSLISGRK